MEFRNLYSHTKIHSVAIHMFPQDFVVRSLPLCILDSTSPFFCIPAMVKPRCA